MSVAAGLGDLLDFGISKVFRTALAPLTAGLSQLQSALLQNVGAFNPLTTVVETFNESMKLQEKALSMGISLDKTTDLIKEFNVKGGALFSPLEAQKTLLANLDAGIRVNSASLMRAHEHFRLTGQNEDSLRKVMITLSTLTKEDSYIQDFVLKQNKELHLKTLVSREALINSLNSLNKDSMTVASLTGQVEEITGLAQTLQAASLNRLSPDSLDAIVNLLRGQESESIALRNFLNVSQDFISKLTGKPEEDVDILRDISKKVMGRLRELTNTAEGQDIDQFRLSGLVESMGGNFLKAIGGLNILSNINEDMVQDFGRKKKEEIDSELLQAKVEDSRKQFQQFIMSNADNIKNILVSVGDVVRGIITWLAKYFDSFKQLKISMGEIGGSTLSSKSDSNAILTYQRQISGSMSPKDIKGALSKIESGEGLPVENLQWGTLIKDDDYGYDTIPLNLHGREIVKNFRPNTPIEEDLINKIKELDLPNDLAFKHDMSKFGVLDSNLKEAIKFINLREFQGIRGGSGRNVMLQSSILEMLKNKDTEEKTKYIVAELE